MIRAPVAANTCFWSASGEFGCSSAVGGKAADANEGFCGSGSCPYEGFQHEGGEEGDKEQQAMAATSGVLERMAQAIHAPPLPAHVP